MATQPGLSRLLLEALRALDAEIVSALQDRGAGGLTPGQAYAMLHIDRAGTRLTELAGRAQVSKQAMMQVVDDLATLGLVRRAPDLADARAKVVKLTARGLRERAQARRALVSVEAASRRFLGDRRYEALRGMLTDLASAE